METTFSDYRQRASPGISRIDAPRNKQQRQLQVTADTFPGCSRFPVAGGR
jgi:hypothetical protein